MQVTAGHLSAALVHHGRTPPGDRQPTPSEGPQTLVEAAALADRRSGALGMSTGLHSAPGLSIKGAMSTLHPADPAFVDVPIERLLSGEYAAERRERIDPRRAARNVEAGPAMIEKGDTIYLATGDADGMMVSLIQSNFWGMGSGVCVPELGFGFQNRGTSFHLEEGHANVYAAGKRPFHTIIPAFLTKSGDPVLAFGVMGGATQPQAHAQIVINLVDCGMNLQEAGDAPRIPRG